MHPVISPVIRRGQTCHPSSLMMRDRTRMGVKFLRSETCMRALARMKGYVSVEAILFEMAAKRKVSRDECVFDFIEAFLKDNEFGGNVSLNNSNK